ncbi:MAG: L-type lectin-domain containing protein [Bryobacteraceae bacterium]|jgi:hypothetical protein
MLRELAAVACLLSVPVFGATSDLTLNGSAKIVTGPQGAPVLWLTPAQQSQAGSAFTTNAVVFNSTYTFSTFFQFQMTDAGYYGASDGMTFTLQTESATALGANGGGLGYQDITPSVAVEFNTWQNSPFDIDDNDVAVLTNGSITGLGPQTPYGVTNCQPTGAFGCMSNGDLWSVWIDYDGTNLHVAIADNSTTRPADLLSYPIDIASILGQSSAFIGFTAGTGAGYENHYIANWQFR